MIIAKTATPPDYIHYAESIAVLKQSSRISIAMSARLAR